MICSKAVFGLLSPNLPPVGIDNGRLYSPGPGICLARCMSHSTSVFGFEVENLPPGVCEPYEKSYAPGPGILAERLIVQSTSVTMADVLIRPPGIWSCLCSGYWPGPGTWNTCALAQKPCCAHIQITVARLTWEARNIFHSRSLFGHADENRPPGGMCSFTLYWPGAGILLARSISHSTSDLGLALLKRPPVVEGSRGAP